MPISGSGAAKILSFDPLIINTAITGANLGAASEMAAALEGQVVTFLLTPWWTLESVERTQKLADQIKIAKARNPEHDHIVLCNTHKECCYLDSVGVRAHFINQNITVSENVFRPLTAPLGRLHKAVHNARFHPVKRHWLTFETPDVLHLGRWPASGYTATEAGALIDDLLKSRGHSLWNPRYSLVDQENDVTCPEGFPKLVNATSVNEACNCASVGLILSAIEGANYASMEYLLSGLPVVSTKSIGGREVFFDEEFCRVVPDDPLAVRDAVEELSGMRIPRAHIRARTIEKVEPQRRSFLALPDNILAERAADKRFGCVWPFAQERFLTWKSWERHLADIVKCR